MYTSLFRGNCWKKFRMAIFGHSKSIPDFLGKLSDKIWNSHFWLFQIYTSLFGKNCQKKIGTAIFYHSKFIPVFLRKIVRKIQNGHFWAIQIFSDNFSVYITLIKCNGLERMKFVHFWIFTVKFK